MISDTIQKETFIEQELKKFDVVEANLIALADAGKGLKITSIEDKAGLEAVRKARIAIKNERVRIKNKGKELRDQANKFNNAVLAKEKEYLAIIIPTEDELQAEENRIAEEKERIDREIIEARQKKTYERLNQLSIVGYVIDYSRAEAMDDLTFAFELAEATKQHEAEQKRLAEERERIKLEAERLAEQNRQYELQRKADQEAANKIAAEQAAKQREIELAKQKLRLEREAVEQQRKQQEEHERQLRLAAEKAERDRLLATEIEKLRIEKEIAEKAERDRLAIIEAKRQAELAPDKEKLIALVNTINNIELPVLSMPEADKVVKDVRGLLDKVSKYISSKIETL